MLQKEPVAKLKQEQNPSLENWMEQIAPFIAELDLRQIMLIGSHDAGCYNAVSFLGKPWVKTQNYTIEQQLKSGVRYFDLRFAYFEGDKTDEFKIAHDVWNTNVTLANVIKPLNDFLEKNPKEIVVVKLSHFRDFNQAGYMNFATRFTNDKQLGKYMVSKDAGQNLNLSKLWNSNKRLIAVTDNDLLKAIAKDDINLMINSEMTAKLWSEDCVPSKWCNTLDVNELKEKCIPVIKSGHPFLWALELILTPDTDYVVKNYLTGGSVEKLAKQVNPNVKEWLYADPEWRDNVNLFVVDFYQSADWVKIAIKANKNRLAKEIASIITQSELKPDDEHLDEDIMLKTASLFGLVSDEKLIKIANDIKSKSKNASTNDNTYFHKRWLFYKFLFNAKFNRDQDERTINLLCSAIYSNLLDQTDCPDEIKEKATDLIAELIHKYSIDAHSMATVIFETVYRPQLDYKYKAPFIETGDRIAPPAVPDTSTRQKAAIEKISNICNVNAINATYLFKKAQTEWVANHHIRSLRQASATELSKKIITYIVSLNKKVGFFGGEKITFNHMKLVLPKSAFVMLQKYQEIGNDQPERFVNECREMAKKALNRNRGTFLNWRQDETDYFYHWLSKIHLPEAGKELYPQAGLGR